jgi:hypothetical protein
MLKDSRAKLNENFDTLRANFEGSSVPADPTPAKGQRSFVNGVWMVYSGSAWVTDVSLHNHDSRNYTRTEMDAALNLKAPVSHNHSSTYQPLDTELTALAGVTSAANTLPYFGSAGWATVTSLTSLARNILDDTSAATVRTTIGCPGVEGELFAAGTVMWFFQDAAPSGWTVLSGAGDGLLAVKGGSNAYNVSGGTAGAGTWTQPTHLHTTGDFTLTITHLPSHYHALTNHTHNLYCSQWYLAGGEDPYWGWWHMLDPYGAYYHTGSQPSQDTGYTGSGSAHNHGNSGSTTTSNTWRPLANVGILATKN